MKDKGAVRVVSELMIKIYFLFTLISNAFIARSFTSILKLRNQIFITEFSSSHHVSYIIPLSVLASIDAIHFSHVYEPDKVSQYNFRKLSSITQKENFVSW